MFDNTSFGRLCLVPEKYIKKNENENENDFFIFDYSMKNI